MSSISIQQDKGISFVSHSLARPCSSRSARSGWQRTGTSVSPPICSQNHLRFTLLFCAHLDTTGAKCDCNPCSKHGRFKWWNPFRNSKADISDASSITWIKEESFQKSCRESCRCWGRLRAASWAASSSSFDISMARAVASSSRQKATALRNEIVWSERLSQLESSLMTLWRSGGVLLGKRRYRSSGIAMVRKKEHNGNEWGDASRVTNWSFFIGQFLREKAKIFDWARNIGIFWDHDAWGFRVRQKKRGSEAKEASDRKLK